MRKPMILASLVLLLAACANGEEPAAEPEEVQEGTEAEEPSEPEEEQEPADDPVDVDPVTLTVASAFPEGTIFNDGHSIFEEVMQEKAGEAVTLDFLGGPEAIPEFELFEALADGVVDLIHIPSAFYVPAMPIVDGNKLSPFSPWEEREAGVFDFWQEEHRGSNVQYLGKSWTGTPFMLYVNEELTEPDLSGLSIRVTPVYRAFVEALGGSAVTTAPGEVYTALERGTVDGYGWPAAGVTEFGWEEVTEFRIDHGFYQTDLVILMNLDRWEELPTATQDLFDEVMQEVERRQIEHHQELEAQELETLVDAGVELLTFPEDAAEEYVQTAEDAAWNALLEAAPQAAELRELYGLE